MPPKKGKTNGFRRSSTLLSSDIRRLSEARGFAVSRVLTHWAEIVGEEIAAICRPVEISYGRQGLGATLSVLTTGAQAPMLEMQKEKLREKVNAAYGYNAIARVRLTQTAATGFAEGQASFNHKPKEKTPAKPSPKVLEAAQDMTADVDDTGLQSALERLGRNVLSKQTHDSKGNQQ